MKYILFIGSKVGYEALRVLVNLKCSIEHVFIESEHAHEHEKFYTHSIDICDSNNTKYTLDPTKRVIREELSNIHFDYILSFGYRKMIPDEIINLAKIAALGTHFSPLPRYRGFAPLNWVLINGETETAVNLFYLDKEVDNGDIVERQSVQISYQDDINTLFSKCVEAFKELMTRAVPKLESGKFSSAKQDCTRATYTCARNPEDGLIDWNLSSSQIYNLVRALTYPYPGAFTYCGGKKIYIWSCEEYDVPKYEGRIPGKVIKHIKGRGVVVLCGEGALLLKDLQLEDAERETAENVLKSVRTTLGNRYV